MQSRAYPWCLKCHNRQSFSFSVEEVPTACPTGSQNARRNSKPSLDDIQARVDHLVKASISANTQLTYKTALNSFTKFRVEYALDATWPAPTKHLVLFLSFCFEKGYSPTTLYTYCSGISFFHKMKSWPDPTDKFIVKKILEGCRRTRKCVDTRMPICEILLEKICNILPQMCSTPYECMLFTAAYTLTYFGLLRISEVVYTSAVQSSRPLLFTDIKTESTDTISIVIRTSKTNQSGKPVKLRIHASNNTNICCVKSVQRFLSARPAFQGHFLCHNNKSPLTQYQFSAILSKSITHLGISSRNYKTHSFRIGRATDLAKNGVSSDTIKKMGRWNSDVLKKYIRY